MKYFRRQKKKINKNRGKKGEEYAETIQRSGGQTVGTGHRERSSVCICSQNNKNSQSKEVITLVLKNSKLRPLLPSTHTAGRNGRRLIVAGMKNTKIDIYMSTNDFKN